MYVYITNLRQRDGALARHGCGPLPRVNPRLRPVLALPIAQIYPRPFTVSGDPDSREDYRGSYLSGEPDDDICPRLRIVSGDPDSREDYRGSAADLGSLLPIARPLWVPPPRLLPDDDDDI